MSNRKPIKREISSDNSCLFNAVNYACNKDNHNEESANILRQIVCSKIKEDTIKYDTSFLGMSNEDYQEYILNPKNWGGAIELDILSNYFVTMICAYDIKTLKKHCFGECENYDSKVFLIYDGMHYDVLIMSHDETFPYEYDITKFSSDDLKVDEDFFNLVYELHSNGNYIDLEEMKLICLDCDTKFKEYNEAIEHAQKMNHNNLAQID